VPGFWNRKAGTVGTGFDLFTSYGHGVPGIDDLLPVTESGYELWQTPTGIADLAEINQVREWVTLTALANVGIIARIDAAQMNILGGGVASLVVTVDGADTGVSFVIPAGTTSNTTFQASGAAPIPAGHKLGLAFRSTGAVDTGSALRGEFRLLGSAKPLPAPLPLAPPAGMVLWLEADKGVTVAGADVTAWADQSGNAFDAGPLTAGGTRALQFVAAALNGLPGLQGTADLGAQGLKYTASNLFATLAPRTIFAVVTFDGVNMFGKKGGVVMSFRRSSPSFSPCMDEPYTFGPQVNAQRPFTYEESPVNSMYVVTPVDYSGESKLFRWGTDAANPATTIQVFDGGAAIPQQTTAIPATTESGLAAGYIVGCLIEDDGANVFQGMLHEIIVYAGIMTPATIAQAEGYLRLKWGLP
jgi:hypothetical protein